MKILLLSPLPPPSGGIATWTKLYLNSNKSKENHIRLVNTAMNNYELNNPNKRSLVKEFRRTIRIYTETCVNLKSNDFDVIHINTSCSTKGMFREYLCLRKMKHEKAKMILHCHCDTEYMVRSKIAKFIFKKMCNTVDKVICLNKSSYNNIKKSFGIESVIIPNFLDKESINLNKEKKILNKIKTVLFVGHVIKTKGCFEIIEVAKLNPHINFRLVGYIGNEINEVEIPSNVVFTGEVTKHDVFREMSNADLFLFPSHTEGFPNVILEAMACGLPIISTTVGAIPDMIENKGGLTVNVNDVQAINSALNRLQDYNLRLEYSRWNIQKVKKSYELNVVMQSFYKLYCS